MSSNPEPATLFFWEGAVLLVGRLADTRVHKHNAIQVCQSIDTPFRIMLDDRWKQTEYVVIPANIPHQLDASSAPVALALLDNDSYLGQEMATFKAQSSSLSAAGVAVLPSTLSEAQHTLLNMLGQLNEKPIESQSLPRDPRIERAVRHLVEVSEETLRAGDIATSVGLSESRFLHLFTQHMGLPFRRYVLWRRIRKSITQIVNGSDLTTAAHAGGFSDLAHFSRTFKQNFGLSPSKLLQNSRNVQVIL